MFCQWLSYIVIDKAHIIWYWKIFKKEYGLIGYLKDTFLKLSIFILLGIVIPNILEYIYK